MNRLGFLIYIPMRLMKFEGYTLTIEPEALVIKSIRTLWNRDKTQSKERALAELGYIYFMVDPRSTYSYLTDLADRSEKIVLEEGLPKNWKPDKIVQEAMKSYGDSVITTSSLLLEDTRVAVDKLRKYLRDIDLTAEDDKNKPKYPLNTVTSSIKLVPSLAEDLMKAERIVAQEIVESNKMRGQKEKTILEDGL
jgi:hypothetical protein